MEIDAMTEVDALKNMLRLAVQYARDNTTTELDARELLRDLLDEMIYESGHSID